MKSNKPTDLERWIVQNLDDYIDNENQYLNEHSERVEVFSVICNTEPIPCPKCGGTMHEIAEWHDGTLYTTDTDHEYFQCDKCGYIREVIE